MAEQDDTFPEIEGLEMFRIADKELDNYNYESARYQYESTLSQLVPQDTLQQIYGLAKLAKTTRRMHDLDLAWEYITQAEELGNSYFQDPHPVQAFLYHEKGELAGYYGRYSDAEASLKLALDLRIRIYGPDHCITAFTIKELGEFYFFYLEDYQRAAPLIRESFQIMDACIDGSTYSKALAYYNLANLYWRTNENEQAERLGNGALSILLDCREINWDFVPNVYNLLALISRSDYNEDRDEFNLDKAIEYSLKALEVREKYHPDNIDRIISEASHVGMCYTENHQYDLAVKYLDQAMAYLERYDTDNPELRPALLLEYGKLYSGLKDLDRCLEYFDESLDLMDDLYGPCHVRTVSYRDEVGWALRQFDERELAVENYNYNIECLERDADLSDVSALFWLVNEYFSKARLYRETNEQHPDYKNSLNSLHAFSKADSVLRLRKSLSDWSSTILDFAAEFKPMYNLAMESAAEVHSYGIDKVAPSMAYDFMESNKSYLLFQAINKNKRLKREDLPDSLKQQLIKIDQDIQLLELDAENRDEIEDLARLETLKLIRREINKAIDGHWTDAELEQYAGDLSSLEECQKNMDENDCILQYYYTGSEYYILGITRDSLHFSLIGELDSLKVLLNLLKDQQTTSSDYAGNVNRYERLAVNLYSQLIPASFCMNKDLVIIPDGQLYYYPFEALVTTKKAPGRYSELDYLIKEANVTYAYSVSQYLRMKDMAFPKNGSIYGLFPVQELDAAEREKAFIKKRFRKTEFASENDDKQRIIDKMNFRAIVHIATHGYADTANMNANYLELYNDERLYDYELSTLQMNSRLVYLNACETNLGQQYTGEGVFSLSKAFMQAGCPTVISSLWKIPDNSSAEIARYFYAGLGQGIPMDELFTSSKLAYLEHADEWTSHPYYWAGLLMIGNDTPLTVQPAMGGVTKAFIIVLMVFVLGVLAIKLLQLQGRYSHSRP